MKTLRASWNARVAGADAGQAADITAGAPRLQFGWRRRLPVLSQAEAAE